MSHNDRAAVAESTPPGHVDIDHLISDTFSDRERITKESHVSSALQSDKMTKDGTLPPLSIF